MTGFWIYLKIKQTAEEKVRDVLINSKILLGFATVSVIESLRRNPESYNFVLNDISNNNDTDATYYGSNYLSLILPGRQLQLSSYVNNNICTTVILQEAENLYSKLTIKLPNDIIGSSCCQLSNRSKLIRIRNNSSFMINIVYSPLLPVLILAIMFLTQTRERI